MMKKNKLLFAALVALPLLAACSQTIYYPSYSYPGDPLKGSKQTQTSGEEGGDIDRSETNMTVYFYLDYSHSDTPIYEMRWYMLAPLEKIPDEAKLEDKDAPDPLYWKFLGYSEYPSCLDESKLWNFETDYKLSNVLKLYGIWVSR